MSKRQSKVKIDDRGQIIEQLRCISFASLAGIFDDDDEISLPPETSDKWYAIKEVEKTVIVSEDFTKTTFKIKLWDKLAAMRLLCQIQGINGLENMIKSVRSAGYDVFDPSKEDPNTKNQESAKPIQLAFNDLLS